MYALATIPLINLLSSIQDVTQVWYTDDASAAGGLTPLRKWWDHINSSGPAFGYHIIASKMWLLVKKQYLYMYKPRGLFKDSEVQIITQGCPYLGAPLESDAFVKEFVSMKVKEWCNQLLNLANTATIQCTSCNVHHLHAWICSQTHFPCKNYPKH